MAGNPFVLPKLGYFSWDEILRSYLLSSKCNNYQYPNKKLVRIIYYAFFSSEKSWRLRLTKDADILFIGSLLDRESNMKRFLSVADMKKSDYICCSGHNRFFSLFKGLRMLFFLFPCWFFILLNKGFKIKDLVPIIIILKNISDLQDASKVINTCLDKYKLLVCFFDSRPEESYFVHLFKKKRISTATLMHGQFIAGRENIVENCGLEFKSSYSDYFLCWNNFTVEEAIKEGLKKDRLIVLGIISYINQTFKKCLVPNNKTFGVVLSHPTFETENIALINAANTLANKTGLNFVLKLHPNYDEHYFDDLVSREFYKGCVEKGISMYDYANMVDFSIVGSSSVFVELIYLYHNIIRYSSGRNDDKFRDIKIGSYFSKPDQIVDVFAKGFDSEEKEKLFYYMCSVKNIYKSYLNFFNGTITL